MFDIWADFESSHAYLLCVGKSRTRLDRYERLVVSVGGEADQIYDAASTEIAGAQVRERYAITAQAGEGSA